MPKLSDIVPSRSWITVPFPGGGHLRVAYRPSVVTPRLQKAVAAAQLTQDIDAGLLEPLTNLIESWDLTDEDGALVPITAESLIDVPGAILFPILDAIGADMAPNRSRGAASPNGSSPTASVASPTGISN